MKPDCMKPLSLFLTLLFAVITLNIATLSAAEKPKKLRVLFITQSKGYVHKSVKRQKETLSPAEIAMIQLGQQTKLFKVDCTQNCEADFTKENLKKYDIVMLYTSGNLPISTQARDYFKDEWLKQKGHGLIGFHSATDTYRNDKPEHQWYREIIGGTFKGHPWNLHSTVTITVHDPHFPAMKPFGKEFKWNDEIYQYTNWVPENVHVLMSLNMAKTKIKKPYQVPVAWARNWGQGRIFYNNMGHRDDTWTKKPFLESVTAAVQWVSGQVDGDATPNPKVSQAQHEKSIKDAGGK